MANGDDGYVDGGGGGSVWWEMAVSEGQLYSTEVVNLKGHPPRKDGHTAYKLRGRDSYTEQPGPNPDPRGDALIVVTIPDVQDITRIEFVGNALRLYMPVAAGINPVRQFSIRWGIRKVVQRAFNWANIRTALKNEGAVETADKPEEVTRQAAIAASGGT